MPEDHHCYELDKKLNGKCSWSHADEKRRNMVTLPGIELSNIYLK
jgi:hypothetical protein